MNRFVLLFQRTSWLSGALVAAAFAILLPAHPAEAKNHQTVGNVWTAQGPSPVADDLVNVPPDNGVVGAVHALVPHPKSADVLYIGAVNGGIWVTYNATATKPHWEQLTDKEESLSIGALDLDPTDKKFRTLVAGPGAYSAYGDFGDLAGLLFTDHLGEPDKWQRLTGGGVMLDKSVSGIAVRGKRIVAAVDVARPFTYENVGIFRSTNNGNSFTQISQGDGSATGLPGGVTYDLAGDPNNPGRLFTTVLQAEGVGGRNGIYRSDNTGGTWTKVSSPAIDAFLISGRTVNVELTVGRHNNVYAAIVNNFVLAAFFRSGDGGATWTQMDLPVTIEDGTPQGINPGGQGDFHLSLVADPDHANIVYIGGDRQPARNEADDNATRAIFPNSIGSTGFWGRLFRGDASKPSGSQWVHLTHSNVLGAPGGGTASGSAPHVDSRELAFDAAGNLIEGDDGGVYKRTLPRSNTGDWFSLNGDIQITEVHDAEFDHNTETLFAGTQDNDAIVQLVPGSKYDWTLLLYGDGGDVNVDDMSTPDRSVRYTSVNFLRNFNRSTWDPDGNLLAVRFLPLTPLDGAPAIQRQFYTPVRISKGDPDRLVIGAANGVYETMDQGETVSRVGPGIRINSLGFQALAYGAPANADALYVGGADVPAEFPGNKLWVRTGPPPAPLVRSLSYPGTLPIRAIAIDPTDGAHAFVVDAEHVYRTTNAGVAWTDVTDDLVEDFEPSILRSVTFANTPNGKAVVVGANRGVYVAPASEGYAKWSQIGKRLPNAPVFDVRYDSVNDQLVAGTLGRGIWTLNDIGLAVLMAD